MYIAKKPCNFGGKRRYIGDEIPDEFIAPGNEAKLVNMGLIELVPDKEPETPVPDDAVPEKENPQGNAADAADGVKQPDNVKQETDNKKAAASNNKRGGNGGNK